MRAARPSKADTHHRLHPADLRCGWPVRPIEPCREYVERLKKSGADVTLLEFPGATHGYDLFTEPQNFPQAQTMRNCRLIEGDGGQIMNTKTGKPFSLNDPCVERGTTVASDEEATKVTTKAVKELLTSLPSSKVIKN